MSGFFLWAWPSILLGHLAFFFFAVLPGVVTDREVNVVPLPATREVMVGFHQLGEEPGQDDWEKQNRKVGHDVMCLV
jgi:hypothetical protein